MGTAATTEHLLHCPQCGTVLPPGAEACPVCSAPVGLAAAAAEVRLLDEIPTLTAPPPTTEALIPRLGETLVQKGWITSEQLENALAYQRRQKESGRDVRLGQALIELGYLTPEALDRAIAEHLWRMQQALKEANASLEAKVREHTRQLRQALDRVQELSRIKANFVARVSHELRTPLTHLIGYLDLMAQEQLGPLSENQRQAVQVMRRAVNRLHRLVEDLIRFSLLSRGELSLNIKPVSTDYLCKAALEPIWAQAHVKGIQVEQRCPEQSVLVKADGEKIVWALHHLLDNAVKFTPPGGTVRLIVEYDAQARLVTIAVEDTGPGIPAQRLEEIFEPFHQLEEANTRRHGGLGLGLALVRQLLEAHGVDLQVKTAEGQGTRFWFTLPAL